MPCPCPWLMLPAGAVAMLLVLLLWCLGVVDTGTGVALLRWTCPLLPSFLWCFRCFFGVVVVAAAAASLSVGLSCCTTMRPRLLWLLLAAVMRLSAQTSSVA